MTMSIKKKLVTVALSGAVLASGLAAADGMDLDPKVYVGAEAGAAFYNGTKEIKTNVNSTDATIKREDGKSLLGNKSATLSGFIGTRLNQYFGLEAGYSFMQKPGSKLTNLVAKDNAGNRVNLQDATNVKTKMSNGYIDAMGYVPVTDQIEAIGSLGVGILSTSLSGSFQGKGVNANLKKDVSEKSTKVGVRLGAGVGYKFDENIGARFMVRYQQGNKHVKGITTPSLGLFYQF